MLHGDLCCRDIATLADLESFLCSLVKVESFYDLQMGPLLANDLVLHNFHPPPTVVEVPRVGEQRWRLGVI